MKERLLDFLAGGSNFSTKVGQDALLQFIQHELEIFTDTWVYNTLFDDLDLYAKDYVKRYLEQTDNSR